MPLCLKQQGVIGLQGAIMGSVNKNAQHIQTGIDNRDRISFSEDPKKTPRL